VSRGVGSVDDRTDMVSGEESRCNEIESPSSSSSSNLVASSYSV
jgi:hypothetical protein